MKPLAHYVGERNAEILRKLRRVPLVYRLYVEARMAIHALHVLGPKLLNPAWFLGRSVAPRQRPLIWQTRLDELKSGDALASCLRARRVRFSEGLHTIYLPPQPGLESVLGECVQGYPPQAGFKILKIAAPPHEAIYRVDARQHWVASKWMGGVLNQVDAANLLFGLGLGPRLFDLAELRAGDCRLTSFVSEHVEGGPPSASEHAQFVHELESLLSQWKNAIAIVAAEGLEHGDFLPPDCNANLIRRASDGALFYVDFQQFRLLDRNPLIAHVLDSARSHFHFGGSLLHRGGGKYLYQSVPGMETGKRDTRYRTERICDMLRGQGLDFEDRLVLDVGCNSAMMLAAALSRGARWGMGWDLPELVSAAERLQGLLGNTRLTLVPGTLEAESALEAGVPDWLRPRLQGSIVFFLAVWRHVGWPAALAKIPWKALVFEGHEMDAQEESQENFRRMAALWGCRLVAQDNLIDGDSDWRPLALFVRP